MTKEEKIEKILNALKRKYKETKEEIDNKERFADIILSIIKMLEQ